MSKSTINGLFLKLFTGLITTQKKPSPELLETLAALEKLVTQPVADRRNQAWSQARRDKLSATMAQKRADQHFLLTVDGDQFFVLRGWQDLSQALRLKEQTLRCYFSKSQGKSVKFLRGDREFELAKVTTEQVEASGFPVTTPSPVTGGLEALKDSRVKQLEKLKAARLQRLEDQKAFMEKQRKKDAQV